MKNGKKSLDHLTMGVLLALFLPTHGQEIGFAGRHRGTPNILDVCPLAHHRTKNFGVLRSTPRCHSRDS